MGKVHLQVLSPTCHLEPWTNPGVSPKVLEKASGLNSKAYMDGLLAVSLTYEVLFYGPKLPDTEHIPKDSLVEMALKEAVLSPPATVG